jgi:hypothetical protein
MTIFSISISSSMCDLREIHSLHESPNLLFFPFAFHNTNEIGNGSYLTEG